MPLQLLARPLNLFMGRGNVTHPGITPMTRVCIERKKGRPSPRGQKDRWRQGGWCAGLLTWTILNLWALVLYKSMKTASQEVVSLCFCFLNILFMYSEREKAVRKIGRETLMCERYMD